MRLRPALTGAPATSKIHDEPLEAQGKFWEVLLKIFAVFMGEGWKLREGAGLTLGKPGRETATNARMH